MFEVVILLLSITTATLLATNVGTAKAYIQQSRLRLEEVKQRAALVSTSDRLLAANEEMSRAGISIERVEEAVRNNPNLIPEQLIRAAIGKDPDLIPFTTIRNYINDEALNKAVIAFLKEEKLQHTWKQVGKQRNRISTRNARGQFATEEDDSRTVMTDKCLNCDLIHRYIIGDRKDGDDEGYFRGGVRVALDGTRPDCLTVDTSKLGT